MKKAAEGGHLEHLKITRMNFDHTRHDRGKTVL